MDHDEIDEYFHIRLPMKEMARHLVWHDDELMDILRKEIREAVLAEVDAAFELRDETIASVVRKVIDNG